MLHSGVQKEPQNDCFGGQNLKQKYIFYILINTIFGMCFPVLDSCRYTSQTTFFEILNGLVVWNVNNNDFTGVSGRFNSGEIIVDGLFIPRL